MSLRLERSIKLSCGDSHDIDGVLHSLVTFLEEFKELDVQEPIVLNLDVSEMPLLLDIQHMRNLVSMLATYGECVRKVSLLNITPAPGIQEMLVRTAVAILPFSMPVRVQSRKGATDQNEVLCDGL